MPVTTADSTGREPLNLWWKRPLDLLFCVVAAPLVLPVVLLVWLLVRLFLGAPATFRQTRPGLHGRPFALIKFRTMRNACDQNGEPLPDEQRLTGLGRFLRSTSLDELPEFWNIVTGAMTLVGPRPLLVEYLPIYSEKHQQRHLVPPGLTGWAQINGRNSLSWPAKLDMDVWYVQHCCLLQDIKILIATPLRVLLCKGVAQAGHATADRFAGYDTPGSRDTDEAIDKLEASN